MNIQGAESLGGTALTKSDVADRAVIDPDILKLLGDASVGWLLPSEAYRLGVIDGRKQVIDGAKAREMMGMIPYAEMFYIHLQNIVPNEFIRQHRIGIDYKTGVPTSLTVIAQCYDEKMTDIMHLSRSLELGITQRYDLDYNFWVITDSYLDQELIESDFPYYRNIEDAVK